MTQGTIFQISTDPELKEQDMLSNGSKRILGIAEGKYEIPDDIDELNDEIWKMFFEDYDIN